MGWKVLASKQLALFTVGATLLPMLAACGSSTPSTSSPATSAPANEAPAATAADSSAPAPTAADASAPAPTAATSGASGEAVTIELFTRPSTPEVSPPAADWAWGKAVKEALNIDVKLTIVTEASQYNAKLQTRAAANDLPDLFQTDAIVQSQLASQGLVADWEPYLASMPQYVADRNVEALKPVGTFDGKMYGLTSKNGYPYKTVTLIRKDWLDKLGLEIPKTLDELEAVAKAFTTQDPDGNGQADTYGFSAAINSDGSIAMIDPILGAFDALGDWRVVDGQLTPVSISENRRAALEFLNKLDQDGVMDPDWKAQKPEDFRLKWKAGKLGIFSEDWCAGLCKANYDQFLQANPTGVLQIIDPPTGPNGASSAGIYNQAGQMYGMSQKAADAGKGEAIARLLEWMNGDGYAMTVFGEEGADKGYTLDASGAIVPTGNVEYRALGTQQLVGWGVKGTDDEFKSRYGIAANNPTQGDGTTLDVYQDVLLRAKGLPKTEITEFAPLPPVPAELAGDYSRTVNEGAFQFASGAMPFDQWQTYVDSVKAAGLDAWLEIASARAKEAGITQ